MNHFDKAPRRATQLEPLFVTARLGELAKLRWRFVDWAPTQTAQPVHERDQTADRAVVLEDLDVAGRLWLALMEFQSEHVPDKIDDLFAEAAQFRRTLRHGSDRKQKYHVMPALVYLVGGCPDEVASLDMRSPSGHGVLYKPLIWPVGEDSAADALGAYEQGRTTWGALFWVPLTKGADDAALVARWLALVQKLEVAKSTLAELRSIALVLAGLAGRGQVWSRLLEGWTLTESPIVKEWIRQGAEEEVLSALRKASLDVLKGRFPGQVPADVAQLINDQPSPQLLNDWLVKAALLPSIEEIAAYFRR
jgi:hypothetical protein